MPFKSEDQRKFMFANHPEIAKRWTQESKRKGMSDSNKLPSKGKQLPPGRGQRVTEKAAHQQNRARGQSSVPSNFNFGEEKGRGQLVTDKAAHGQNRAKGQSSVPSSPLKRAARRRLKQG